MICPVDLASDMSALRAARVGDHRRHGLLLEGHHGAGDEGTGSDFAGDGEEDYLVAGGGDHRHQRPADATLAERYEEFGYDGLFDRRQGKPSPKRVPVAVVERVLGLYRDRYFDLNVRHFHEKLQGEHGIQLSYTWVKLACKGRGW
jgi:hypothetical protein